MKPLSKEEILSFEDWERVRPRLRPLFIHAKNRRRLALGPHLTLLFENGQTIWYQVEEMLRAEKIAAPDAIQHEIDTYNELLPPAGGLAATMLIEFGEPRERDAALRRLVGLENHVWLRLGDRRIAAKFDTRQMSSERISSVQFIHFDVSISADQFEELAAAGKAVIEIDHPHLAVRETLSGALAQALAEDLRAEI
jgi:hypothetical protein